MSGSSPVWSGLGVALPCIDAFGTGSPVLDVARAAEAAGLDHVWVPDHLVFHRPVLEATVVLGAVAGATERIRLGTAILNPVLRPSPTWLAKQLATIAVLAPGRLLLGVGLGGEYEPEFRAAGIDRRERGRRLDEVLAVLAPLLRGEAVEHEGLYSVACDGLSPVPAEPPPVLIGGRSDAALRRAARVGDAWLPMWMSPEEVAEARDRLAELADELGRPAPGIGLVAFVNVCDNRGAGAAEAAELIERQYGMPFHVVEKWTALGDEAEVATFLQSYRDVGVDGFSLGIASADQVGQVGRLAAVRDELGAFAAL